MKVLFCIVGRTASGKDTLSDSACKKYGFKKLASYTTRPPRNEFEDTHIFTTRDKFAEHYAAGQIAAYSQIGEYLYWSTQEQLINNDFYIIDYTGLKQIQQLNVPDLKIVTIYIKAPEEERYKRAFMRNPNFDIFLQRNKAEQEQFDEFESSQQYDYLIYNNRFADAEKHLDEIIQTEIKL